MILKRGSSNGPLRGPGSNPAVFITLPWVFFLSLRFSFLLAQIVNHLEGIYTSVLIKLDYFGWKFNQKLIAWAYLAQFSFVYLWFFPKTINVNQWFKSLDLNLTTLKFRTKLGYFLSFLGSGLSVQPVLYKELLLWCGGVYSPMAIHYSWRTKIHQSPFCQGRILCIDPYLFSTPSIMRYCFSSTLFCLPLPPPWGTIL